MIDEECSKILKQYHKLSDRHILVVETDMPILIYKRLSRFLIRFAKQVMNLLVL